ncbi:S41 family peptidase [Parafilimonas sp.]|uniref:S41 family peptidase n=1 Tax=Parafilimonas sp. TaxID=1969739 RepID=UPI0039E62B87
MRAKILLLCALLFMFSFLYSQQKGYYRTPAINGSTIIFTAEGDLWKYDLNTGFTMRLTTDKGLEINPVISPDGKQMVFNGQYEGISELYFMSINGGIPRRITYDFDGAIQAYSWTKDGKIIYRTSARSSIPASQIFKLDPATLAKEIIPLWQASYGCYDDNNILFFTRFRNQGSKTKRYKGGLIEQVWKFNGSQEAVNLTGDYDGASTSPMIYNNRVYFLSDRDGTMNIWSMNEDGKDLKQHTFSKGWDIQTPSINGSKIVYQKGADIWMYDISSNQEKMLDINLVSDFDQRKAKWIKSPVESISNADISPNGNYAVIISRGRVFVSPGKSDRWQEISRKSGVRFKEAHFINNKSIAALSDASGEYEVWKMNADGSDTAVQVTKNTKTIISFFRISPDGKQIAFCDKNDVLRIADVANGTVKFTFDSAYSGINELVWSPDSRYLTFSQNIANLNAQIFVVDTRNMKMLPLTTSRLNSYNPSWSQDSNWLYFVSERQLVSQTRSPWGSRQPEPYYTNTAKMYAMPLDSAAKFPFLQTDSWLTDSVFNPSASEQKASGDKKQKGKTTTPAEKNYNWSYLKNILYEAPVKSANIYNMAVANGYLYWTESPSDQNDNSGSKLYALKIEESKKYEPTLVASGINGFTASGDGKKLLVFYKNNSLAIADANGQKADADKTKLELDNWSFVVDPQEDWKQMFNDAWRMMRDYFYDRNLHNVNWAAIRDQYAPLVARLTDRYELDDLLSQMVGELSALHTFVTGGDKRRSDDLIQAGFLGAFFTKIATGLRIDHIYKSDPDYPDFSSPLNKPELNIKEGDVITAVNNVAVKDEADMATLLANKIDEPVKLSLLDKNNKPYFQVVKPCSARDAATLRYEEWELVNREKVDSLSNDDIGYVHLKAMTGPDMDDFVKQFYPVFNRRGLILDVRENFGGNIDSWVLEKLLRKAWMYWQGRAGGPTWNMQYAFRGHMVILCDQQTASDGEAITEGFRRLGLGKVIGTRTWGGEIWLSMDNRLVDGGIASAAENGVYGPEGKWLIEGRGVEPDIVVDNLPYETFKGKDAQLEYAVDYLKQLIKEQPVEVPKAPAYPDKSVK